ncbi:50S ribosomal protein L31 [Candidatus Mesenet endosymbiont of Agriotes lineatus]|uniref:50S ribosomal protein L31 n=1 Tax=Candidatus Mesenet endosymbiont of Agriotes lineatus TaxID=3077948 RepID=UPI0030D614A1
MAESDIDYHKIIIVMTNGERFETRSTYGSEGDVVTLNIDSHNHPAWTGNLADAVKKTSKLAKFKDRYGDLF